MKNLFTVLVITLIVILWLVLIGGTILIYKNYNIDVIPKPIGYIPITNLTTLTKLTAW